MSEHEISLEHGHRNMMKTLHFKIVPNAYEAVRTERHHLRYDVLSSYYGPEDGETHDACKYEFLATIDGLALTNLLSGVPLKMAREGNTVYIDTNIPHIKIMRV